MKESEEEEEGRKEERKKRKEEKQNERGKGELKRNASFSRFSYLFLKKNPYGNNYININRKEIFKRYIQTRKTVRKTRRI